MSHALRCACVAALVVTGLLVGAAVAGAQPFYGFNAVQGRCQAGDWVRTERPTSCRIDRMEPAKYALGRERPAVYRMRLQWNIIEAHRAGGWSNPWKEYDQELAWAAERGVKVLVIPTLTTSGSTSGETWDFPDEARELSRWQTFIQELVAKYGRDTRVVGAELWNEPNGSTVYTGGVTVTPPKYAALACSAINGRRAAVEAGATRLPLIVGSIAYNTSGILGSYTPSPGGYMSEWMNQVGAEMPTQGCPRSFSGTTDDFDGVSLHVYASPQVSWLAAGRTAANTCEVGSPVEEADRVNGCRQAEQFDLQVRGFRTHQTTAGGAAKPLYVTEFGWHRTTVGSQLGTPTSQQYGYRYTFAKCKAAQRIEGAPGIYGCYAYPITTVEGFGSTQLESEGLWGPTPTYTASLAAPEYLNALLDQQTNPTQYP
jgi:hypothetical protein